MISPGFAFGETTCDVTTGGFVSHAGEHDVEERRVGFAVPATVEPIPGHLARRGGDGGDPTQVSEGGSERSRSGLSPAVTSKLAAVSSPTPSTSNNAGRFHG